MKKIGGNITAFLQLKTGTVRNEIGEAVPQWTTLHTITGFLDLSAGDSRYSTYDAKIQESTHVFICDYLALDERIRAENSRLILNGKTYDIMMVDDPMELHRQFEFYLKYTGGQ